MPRFAAPIAFVLAGLAVSLSAACGDSATLPDPGPSSGVATSTRLVDLSEADAGALCDWVAGRFGGYGKGVTCTNGLTVSARQSRELCVMDYRSLTSSCPVTVADVEQCTNESVAEPRCPSVPSACFAIISCAPVAATAAGP